MTGRPQMLISRHVARLLELGSAEFVDRLLASLELVRAGGLVERRDGGALTTEDCYLYKMRVRELFDPLTFDAARASFTVGGCHCTICGDERMRVAAPM